MRRPLILVVGPTAAGKSELAVALADRLDGEVVSADALQVYRGLDIGTAKAGPDLRRRVPHHCIDVLPPTARCNAGDYARMARPVLAAIRLRGRQPVVAGGSGLYLEALTAGLNPLPRRDPGWRRVLESVRRRRGAGYLRRILELHDPTWAEGIDSTDEQRLLRAVEVILRTGRRFSDLVAEERPEPEPDALWIGMSWPRQELYRRIEERFDRMLAAGWVDEVRRLMEAGVPPDAHALQAIGYRQIVAHLRGELELEEVRRRVVRATRRYAKRQLTWFRNRTPTRWFERSVEAPDVTPRVLEHLRTELPC